MSAGCGRTEIAGHGHQLTCGGPGWGPGEVWQCDKCRIAELEALLKWREIETAPKDGTRLLVHQRGVEIPCVAYFDGEQWLADETHHFGDGVHDNCSALEGEHVTHWRPLGPSSPPPDDSKVDVWANGYR